jgi:tetratricopeptide (TPR) repeat protein
MLLLLVLALGGLLPGCATNYAEGQYLESQNRWEEAAISYHLAVIDDPEDEEYREALARAQKVVARENMERYREYLAQKAFKKAYQRLEDAARQDPSLQEAKDELNKWQRVLLAGQIELDIRDVRADISLADQIALTIRLNSPNLGETVAGEIDLSSGIFLVEDLLYDRPLSLQAYYTINAIGVSLVRNRTDTRQFTSRDFQRFIDFRTPTVESLSGELSLRATRQPTPVATQRDRIDDRGIGGEAVASQSGLRYSLQLQGNTIRVQTSGTPPVFTPRLLYLNNETNRLFIDFGRYVVRQETRSGAWRLSRLPIAGNDHYAMVSKVIALRPYFFYREGVYTYVYSLPR